MTKINTAALGLAIMTLAAGAALAQTSSDGSTSSGNMSGGSASSAGSMSTGATSNSGDMTTRSMSKADMATIKRCKAMSNDMMMKDTKCMKMMKMHPNMMTVDPPMSH